MNLGFSKEDSYKNIEDALKAVNMLEYNDSSCQELSLRTKAKNCNC